jgi:hypothetical protein
MPLDTFGGSDPSSIVLAKMNAVVNYLNAPSYYYVTHTISGTPADGFNYYIDLPSNKTIQFKAGLSGSTFQLKTAATSEFVVTIKKDGSSIGTLTVAAAGTVAAVSFTSDVSFTGNELSFSFPSTADATASDFKISMIGQFV